MHRQLTTVTYQKWVSSNIQWKVGHGNLWERCTNSIRNAYQLKVVGCPRCGGCWPRVHELAYQCFMDFDRRWSLPKVLKIQIETGAPNQHKPCYWKKSVWSDSSCFQPELDIFAGTHSKWSEDWCCTRIKRWWVRKDDGFMRILLSRVPHAWNSSCLTQDQKCFMNLVQSRPYCDSRCK